MTRMDMQGQGGTDKEGCNDLAMTEGGKQGQGGTYRGVQKKRKPTFGGHFELFPGGN